MNKIFNATLPIKADNDFYLSLDSGREFGEKLTEHYCFADPFPHIVIDNFLPKVFIEKILVNFPSESKETDILFDGNYAGHHKRQIYPHNCDEFVRNTFSFFNSAPFLCFLEGLTTINGIISDPYFSGGGFHEISRGGQLGIHADFRIHEKLHLNRRLNVLIYLNKDWKEEYGGELEIWNMNAKLKARSIAPIFNRCVIFNTDADSYHGHPDPLNTPESVKRKSLALYYYTASKKIYEELPMYSTMYTARPTDGPNIAKQVRASNITNYKKDWIPPLFLTLSIRSFLPPWVYRRIKSFKNSLKL